MWEIEPETDRSGQFPTGTYLVIDGATTFEEEENIAKVYGLKNARLIAKAPEMYRLIKLSLQAGRFPEVGDGCEMWNPAEVARALLREIENKPQG